MMEKKGVVEGEDTLPPARKEAEAAKQAAKPPKPRSGADPLSKLADAVSDRLDEKQDK